MLSRGVHCAAAMLLAGCVSAPLRQTAKPSPEEEVALARSRTKLSTALIDADAAAAGNVFATDAVLMNPNNPDVHGRETIEARFRGIKKGVIRVLNFTPVEIVMCGDRAYDLSVFEEEIAPPEKAPIQDRGRAMFVWQRDPDGTWRIHHMLVNGALPKGQGVH